MPWFYLPLNSWKCTFPDRHDTCASSGDSTQLVYLRARYYAPNMGRFISRDTWGGDFDQPVTYNKWVYANANPVLYADPSGRIVCPYGRDPETGECLPNSLESFETSDFLPPGIAEVLIQPRISPQQALVTLLILSRSRKRETCVMENDIRQVE